MVYFDLILEFLIVWVVVVLRTFVLFVWCLWVWIFGAWCCGFDLCFEMCLPVCVCLFVDSVGWLVRFGGLFNWLLLLVLVV